MKVSEIADSDGRTLFSLVQLIEEVRIKPSIREFYEIYWFGRAGGTMQIDFNTHIIDEHSWAFITPGQVFGMKSFQTVAMCLQFHTDLLSPEMDGQALGKTPLFHRPFLHTVIQPEGQDQTGLDILTKLIAQEYNRPRRSEFIVRRLLEAMIEVASRAWYLSNEKPDLKLYPDPRVDTLMVLIENHFGTEHDTRFYSRALEISPQRANGICKEHSGLTIKKALLERQNLESRRQIGYSDIPINIIAGNIGHANPAYFGHLFKNRNRLTPQQFRDKCSNNDT